MRGGGRPDEGFVLDSGGGTRTREGFEGEVGNSAAAAAVGEPVGCVEEIVAVSGSDGVRPPGVVGGVAARVGGVAARVGESAERAGESAERVVEPVERVGESVG